MRALEVEVGLKDLKNGTNNDEVLEKRNLDLNGLE